ncbi:MAG: nitroreductase family protein, partial [Candidatus Bathyarchaeia archaeon]
DFIEVVKTRRSIRRYKPDPVPDEILNEIMEAARLAPSAGHRQPWHFIVVKDPEKKKQLGISSWAAEAPIVIVGCGDASVSPIWYMVDLAIAFEHIVLAAANFGLGTCWIGKLGVDETIRRVLNIPEHVKVVAVTPLGYPAETPVPKARKSISEIVHYEKF